MSQMTETNKMKRPEPEYQGSIWKHPYMLYILLTLVLFVFLLAASWIAWSQGWIPKA